MTEANTQTQVQPMENQTQPQAAPQPNAEPTAMTPNTTLPNVSAPIAPNAAPANFTMVASNPMNLSDVGEANLAQPQQMPNAQDAIIAQLQAQNAALLQQTQALNAQVVQFIQGGAQLTAQQPQQAVQPVTPPQVQQMLQMGAQPDPLGTFNPPSLAGGQDMSLEALASQIGKQE